MASLPIPGVCSQAVPRRRWGRKSGSLSISIAVEYIIESVRTEQEIRVQLEMVVGVRAELNRRVCLFLG